MSNRKVRLIQVAKEFKVGLNSITDFLLKKGVSDVSPNSQVNDDVYAMLEKEFGGNKGITGNERDNVRERIRSTSRLQFHSSRTRLLNLRKRRKR